MISQKNLWGILILIIIAITLEQAMTTQPTSFAEAQTPTFQVQFSGLGFTLNSTGNDQGMDLSFSLVPVRSNPLLEVMYYGEGNEKNATVRCGLFFSEIIEYKEQNTPADGIGLLERESAYNIGNNRSVGNNLAVRGWNAIEYRYVTVEGVIVHVFNLSTTDNVFAMGLSVPEEPLMTGGLEITPYSFLMDLSINNFPYTSENTSLALAQSLIVPSFYQLQLNDSIKRLSIVNPVNQTENYSLELNLPQSATVDGETAETFVDRLYNTPGGSSTKIVNTILSVDALGAEAVTFSYVAGKFVDRLPTSTTFTAQPTSQTSASANQTFDESNDSLFSILDDSFAGLGLPTGEALVEAVTTTSLLLGLVAFLLFLLRKYWLAILGVFFSVGVMLYIPKRKVSAIEVLHNETRRQIMDYLHQKAGSGGLLNELSEELHIPTTTLLWHLQILEEFEYVTKIKIKSQVVVVSNDFLAEFDPRVKELELGFKSEQGELFLAFLSQLKLYEAFTVKQVMSATNWHVKTARKHLRRMMNLGIIKKARKQGTYILEPKFYQAIATHT